MQESVRAAFSYARQKLDSLGYRKTFETHDIHIHVPAGATPKDGPSAGIAIVSSIISAVTGKSVKKEIAMTGEVTLLGRVLPIGGLKEKSLGAMRAGIKTIIFPEKNKNDLIEIPANVKQSIEFIAVSNVEEILDIAIEKFSDVTAKKKKSVKKTKA